MTGNRQYRDDPETMVSVDDALHRILAAFEPLPVVTVPLLEAQGLVLATDVVASENIPPFQNSAMDGYAVRSEDTRDAPVTLRVAGTVAAGEVFSGSVQAGEAIRIMTGAPLPDGADTVVRFEETSEGSGGSVSAAIEIYRPLRAHENVREAGEDIASGTVALPAGTRLRPAEIGMLASLNLARVPVHRRPRVAILSTGNEVVELNQPLGPGQIRNSNSYTIAAMVQRSGGEPVLLGVARDTNADLTAKLGAAGSVDMLVTSGGVSIGDYDTVKDVLRAEGEIDIWQVRMKPGKPLAFGYIGGTPLLGLPGNPAAALVSFEQFGRPAILKMLGRRDLRIPEVAATLTEDLVNRGRRRHYVRGLLWWDETGYSVRPVGPEGSAILTTVSSSNCFIVVPETCDSLAAGTTVQVQLPDEGL